MNFYFFFGVFKSCFVFGALHNKYYSFYHCWRHPKCFDWKPNRFNIYMLEEFIAFVYLYNQEFSVNINVVCLEKNWYHVCLAAVITYFVDDVILFLKTRIVLMKKKEANESFFFQSTSSDLMKCFMIDGCSNFNSKIFLFCQCQLWYSIDKQKLLRFFQSYA